MALSYDYLLGRAQYFEEKVNFLGNEQAVDLKRTFGVDERSALLDLSINMTTITINTLRCDSTIYLVWKDWHNCAEFEEALGKLAQCCMDIRTHQRAFRQEQINNLWNVDRTNDPIYNG